MTDERDTRHICDPGQKRPLYDARMIFCTYVCDECEDRKREQFRPEIFSDPDYDCAEPVEED